jgi:hypothetical protein
MIEEFFYTALGTGTAALIWLGVIEPLIALLPPRGGFIKPTVSREDWEDDDKCK